MSNRSEELRDLLDVVVREEAYAVRFDASKAWGDGRRRRVADGLGVLVAVVVLIGVALSLMSIVLGTTLPLSPASGSGEVAAKHPQRLDYIYWDDEQPLVTGPLAGVVERNAEDGSGWYTVSPEGRLWRLDMTMDYEPSLSPDGSHLGYMRGSFVDATYVIVNQLDGTSRTFPQIGTGSTDGEGNYSDSEYFYSGQTPAFWSPDGDELLLRIGTIARVDSESDPAAAVLGADGSFTKISALPGRGRSGANPVGWVDDDHVAFVARVDSVGKVRVWVVDVRTGEPVRSFFLEGQTAEDEFMSQWFGRLSPDGSELATGTTTGVDMRFYSMRSDPPGALTDTLPAIPDADTVCSPSWTSSDLYLPTRSSDFDLGRGDGAIVARADGEVTIVADPRLNIGCSAWARTALEGPAHKSWGSRLFGDDSNWLAWHWREVSLAALFVLGLLAIRVAVKRGSWRARVRAGARSTVSP